ncbi:hypothetical protein WICMUC_002747 [Wickerhamomyces mucosus]|uniref:Uncharacterized protein n=1 Tax=Wickerhamomyces mucosus TaxID=1378264 RepID=A0A9P8PNM7_9ASCO|nr:hypothetical protein WICMUC_002747 [Wickerhamomyces mucosus]
MLTIEASIFEPPTKHEAIESLLEIISSSQYLDFKVDVDEKLPLESLWKMTEEMISELDEIIDVSPTSTVT